MRRGPSLLDLHLLGRCRPRPSFVVGAQRCVRRRSSSSPSTSATVDLGELLVGGRRQLALDVDRLGALLELLGVRVARRGAQAVGREVDAELLRGAEQLVVLLGDLDAARRRRASASRRARATASP